MIAVIGAGPAGCYYASLVKGEEVHLFEEDPEVGRPVSCTGILTDSVRRVIGDLPPDLIVSRIHAFKLAAPGGRSILVDLDKVNTIVDRAGFDRWLLQKARDNGACLHLGERFTGYEPRDGGYQVLTTRGSYCARCIVGADGPFSAVARAAGIYGERSFVMGRQARCRYPGLQPGITEIRLTLGEFSWIVPEDASVARVGVIGPDTPSLRRDYEALVGDAEVIEDQSGLIPVYNPGQKVRKPGESIFLIGDAATQVKATTYGGIIYGLLAAQYLADNPATYEKRLAARIGRDLWLSLRMREFMNVMTEEQADQLIDIFETEENKRVIARHDRDFPSKFIVQLLMKETRLWKLGLGLLKNRVTGKTQGAATMSQQFSSTMTQTGHPFSGSAVYLGSKSKEPS
jgi:flavin-dependent dehydrogenase